MKSLSQFLFTFKVSITPTFKLRLITLVTLFCQIMHFSSFRSTRVEALGNAIFVFILGYTGGLSVLIGFSVRLINSSFHLLIDGGLF